MELTPPSDRVCSDMFSKIWCLQCHFSYLSDKSILLRLSHYMNKNMVYYLIDSLALFNAWYFHKSWCFDLLWSKCIASIAAAEAMRWPHRTAESHTRGGFCSVGARLLTFIIAGNRDVVIFGERSNVTQKWWRQLWVPLLKSFIHESAPPVRQLKFRLHRVNISRKSQSFEKAVQQ